MEGVVFLGHEKEETILLSLDEMVKQVTRDYQILRRTYPEREIVVLAHSQGCAIALKAAFAFDEKTSFILLAPAIFLSKLILPRVSKEDYDVIESGQPVNCRISRDKFRIITLEWVMSYRNFSLDKELPSIKQRCTIIRPLDDHVERENVEVLCQGMVNCELLEVPGDHIFAEPEGAFDGLTAKLFVSN